MENPFEVLNKRLEAIETQQTDILALLRALIPTSQNANSDKYVGTNEAAKLLGISKDTLWKSQAKLKPIKRFGRLYWSVAHLQSYLETGTIVRASINRGTI